MKSVLKNLRKKDQYFLISTSNFIKDKRVNLIDYKSYVSSMNKNKDIKAFWNSIDKGVDSHWVRSDVLRFDYLANNKDTLYIDTDVMLEKLPKIDKDKTYFVKKKNIFDYFMFYGSKSIIKDIFTRAIKSRFTKTSIFSKVNHKRFINNYEALDTKLFNHLDII
jgi:hypothetical protein